MIDYTIFKLMSQSLSENPSDEEAEKGIKNFFNIDVNEFNRLFELPFTGVHNLKLNFEELPASYYIIADTFVKNEDLLLLRNHLSNNEKDSISIQEAFEVKQIYLNSVSHFKDKYEWIFNPPILPNSNNKYTIGRQLRQEFQEYYGAYAEITYLISGGNALKFDEVNEMKLSDYLSVGEYLIRKRAVEGVE